MKKAVFSSKTCFNHLFLLLLILLSFTNLSQIKAQSSKQQYEQYRAEGDKYLAEKNFLKAKEAYQTALKYKEKDKHALESLAFCKAAIKKQYNIFIKKADTYFKSGNLSTAKKNYRKALIFIADDKYAQEQILACAGDTEGTFYKSYGGVSYDDAKAIATTQDGGYVITGMVSGRGNGSTDINLTKIDSQGKLVWTKNFGGQEADEGRDIIKTSGNNYLLVGSTESFRESPNAKHIWVVKIDTQGNKIWTQTYGKPANISEAHAVTEANDGGFVIVGSTISLEGGNFTHITAIKIDGNGSKIWEKIYTSEFNQIAHDIISTKNGFTIIGNGEAPANGKWDMWLLHIDKQGERIWDKTFGGKDSDVGNALLYTQDGGYIITGYTYSFAVASHDVWIVKTDSAGKKEWEKVYGGDSVDEGLSIIQTKDKGYLIAGYTEVWEANKFGENTSSDGLNAYLVKLSQTGEQEWLRSIGGKGEQRLYDVAQSSDGGYVAVGFTGTESKNMDILVIKVNEKGLVTEPNAD